MFKIYILLLKASENYFLDIFRLVGPSRTGKTIKCINICFLGHLIIQSKSVQNVAMNHYVKFQVCILKNDGFI